MSGRSPVVALIEIVVIAVLSLGIATLVVMWQEPFPYASASVHIDEQVPVGQAIPVKAKVFRTALCPYLLERRAYDSAGTKIYDDARELSTPSRLGADAFYAPVTPDTSPVPGSAVYEARLGAMCNPLRRIWPLWDQWMTVSFEFVET